MKIRFYILVLFNVILFTQNGVAQDVSVPEVVPVLECLGYDYDEKTEPSIEGAAEIKRLWQYGSEIKVAFERDSSGNVGTDERCKQIAEIANSWLKEANLKFSFTGEDGKIRRWSRADRKPAADIRISFTDSQVGYWSAVGTSSRQKPSGQPTMNLHNYHKELKVDWEGTVLHEFGHALGFMHEHQSPGSDCDFRWDDDPGYEPKKDGLGQYIVDDMGRRPGIVTLLSGAPNNWNRTKVEFNLKKIQEPSNKYISTDFDQKSVMLYSFGSWMFKSGSSSTCIKERSKTLSTNDLIVVKQAYPSSEEGISELEKRKLAAK